MRDDIMVSLALILSEGKGGGGGGGKLRYRGCLLKLLIFGVLSKVSNRGSKD